MPKLTCPDCGMQYDPAQPHYMFCSAKTCERCGTTYDHILDTTEQGEQVCEDCWDEDLSSDW